MLSDAIRAACPRAPQTAIDAFKKVSCPAVSDARLASLFGQCGHESVDLTRTVESLYYTGTDRLRVVWPTRFRTHDAARAFVRSPRELANRVYNGRMGNREGSDDGWTYRGRGFLQLTGRENYRKYGRMLDLPLEAEPELAEDPVVAWRIAIAFLDSARRGGKTAFQWADVGNVEMVTRIVNGGLHGLEDRRRRTLAALAVLEEEGTGMPTLRRGAPNHVAVTRLQEALVRAGFPLGAIDGDFGPRTETALRDFQKSQRLAADGIAGPHTWAALVA